MKKTFAAVLAVATFAGTSLLASAGDAAVTLHWGQKKVESERVYLSKNVRVSILNFGSEPVKYWLEKDNGHRENQGTTKPGRAEGDPTYLNSKEDGHYRLVLKCKEGKSCFAKGFVND